MGQEGSKVKKLIGVEVVEAPEVKLGEFIFSTGEKMSFKMGKLTEKQVSKIIGRLVNHVYYIAKHSDKNVILPADIESQIRQQVEELNSKGYVFLFGLRFGENIISEKRLRDLTNPSWVYDPLWTPNEYRSDDEKVKNYNGYTVEELNGSETDIAVIGMFINTEKTGYDPTLMLLGHPYDDTYPNGKITQQNAVKEFLSEKFDGLEISQTDHLDANSMYIMDRNDKIKPDVMYLAKGFKRITLGRRTDDDSIVGVVYSDDGRWGLDRSYGRGDDGGGVGFVAGLEN